MRSSRVWAAIDNALFLRRMMWIGRVMPGVTLRVVDPELAARAGIRLLHAPGLPGKKAPRSVAAAMLEVIVRHIDDAATRP